MSAERRNGDGGEVVDGTLRLAVRLTDVTTLRDSVDLVLPVLIAVARSDVAIFAVAGSEAAGARCWPADPAWSRGLEIELGRWWEDGPLTQWCRDVGVVAPFVVDSLWERFGWSDWPFTLLVAGRPLRHLAYVPLLAGPAVSGYFLSRAQGPFTAQELGRLADLQGILVASHAPFLRATHAQGLLTPRQRQVLHLLHRGLTTHSIAGRDQREHRGQAPARSVRPVRRSRPGLRGPGGTTSGSAGRPGRRALAGRPLFLTPRLIPAGTDHWIRRRRWPPPAAGSAGPAPAPRNPPGPGTE